MALRLTHITEMGTRNHLVGGDKAQSASKADNITAICHPIV
jgi:hypothetical protein